MSALAKQLQQLQEKQRAGQVGPHQTQHTLLLDKTTAKTTSNDLLFTSALLAYNQLCKQQPALTAEGQVMAHEHRGISRNTLTQAVNREWSDRLIRFMLKLSPYFEWEPCQRVLEYLLRNYKVAIFEGQALAVLFLQHWSHPLYAKLISNIPNKIVQQKLPFLSAIIKGEAIHLTYLLKHLAYNHQLMATLILHTLQHIKHCQKTPSQLNQDIEINFGEEPELPQQQGPVVSTRDPRKFLMEVFNEFISRSMTSCYKYVLEFNAKALHSSTDPETQSMVMFLTSRLIVAEAINDSPLSTLSLKLVKLVLNHENHRQQKLVWDFVMIVWQRRPSAINASIITLLEQSDAFLDYLTKFNCSLWGVLVHLIESYLDGSQCSNLIEAIGARVKNDQFYQMHQQTYMQRLTELLQRALTSTNKRAKNFLATFYQENFRRQIAQNYHNKIISPALQNKVLALFEEGTYQVSSKGKVAFSLGMIPAQAPPVIHQQEQTETPPVQRQEQKEESEVEQQQVRKKTIVEMLKEHGIKTNPIRYQDPQTKQVIWEMLSKYYDPTTTADQRITQPQKDSIAEHYLNTDYTLQMFKADVEYQDYTTPLKYLTQATNPSAEATHFVLDRLTGNPHLYEQLLYRQLTRLSLQALTNLAATSYKQAIYKANTLSKKITNRALAQAQPPLQLIQDLLLKLSEAVVNPKKGKHQRLLHTHGRVIARMVLVTPLKRQITRNQEAHRIGDELGRVLGIFGQETLYLLSTGIIQILTRKQFNHRHLRFFAGQVLSSCLKKGTISHTTLTQTVILSVILCSQLTNELNIDPEIIHPSFRHGIAKNVTTEFFGLVKDKFKRILAKKILLFIRALLSNSAIVQSYKATLIVLSPSALSDFLSLFTQLYRMLSAAQSTKPRIDEFRRDIMDRITNLLPLDLRLSLFEPLLPNQQLFHYLQEQLSEHSPQKSTFPALERLMNIIPDEITNDWVLFQRECLLRGYRPSEQTVSQILQAYEDNSEGGYYVHLVCEWAEHCSELLYPYLDHCMTMVAAHCHEPNQFTLACVLRLVISLGQMLQPYLANLLTICLSIDSPHLPTFIQQLTSHLTPATLITLTKKTHKQAQNYSNYALYFKAVAQRGVVDSLNKTYLLLSARILTETFTAQAPLQEITVKLAEVFVQIALKMNEAQLRKIIIELTRWSELKQEFEGSLTFNLRKILTSVIYSQLEEQLQSLFNPFFGYTFEATLKDYIVIGQWAQQSALISQKPGKRSREDASEYVNDVTKFYLSSSLKALTLLFTNDKEYEFLDSVKVDALGDPLIDLLPLAAHSSLSSIAEKQLTDCLVALHICVQDDYQMKSLTYKALLLLKRKQASIQKCIFALIEQLVEALKERFLVIVGDLVPFLLQAAGSRHKEVAASVRRIIAQVEDLSGQRIQSYAQ